MYIFFIQSNQDTEWDDGHGPKLLLNLSLFYSRAGFLPKPSPVLIVCQLPDRSELPDTSEQELNFFSLFRECNNNKASRMAADYKTDQLSGVPGSSKTEAAPYKDWMFMNYTFKRFEGLTQRGKIVAW